MSDDMLMIDFDKIDAAWRLTKSLGTCIEEQLFCEGSMAALSEFGILECKKCLGMGRLPRITADGPDTCKCSEESGGLCHGHGWVITSVDVDKYGRIGTEEEMSDE